MNALEHDRVSRVLLGDPDAARQLVIDHGPMVLGMCAHLSDDVEQDFLATWALIFVELPSWNGTASLERWIAHIAHRRFVNTYGRGSRGAVVQFGARGPRRGDAPKSPIDKDTVTKALAALPHERRRIVVLTHLGSMAPTRIASTEGAQVNEVLAWLHKGRAYVARQLRGDRMPWEELSELFDGEPTPLDREELETRIVGDPACAAAWADMQAVCAVLDKPPRSEVPVALLDQVAAVPGRDLVPDISTWPWLITVLAMMAAFAVAVWPTTPVQVSLDAGIHEVEGAVRVLAADSRVDLNGNATIEVGEDGALTVEVHDGSAKLTGPDGQKQTVRSGTTRTVGGTPEE